MSKKRIGIYGGSFDPITNGHLLVAAEVLNTNSVDEVWFAPCSNRPGKTNLTDPYERITMCHIAVDTFFGSHSKVFVTGIDAFDTEFKGAHGLLQRFSKLNPDDELLYVVGGDSVLNINEWVDYEKIIKQFKFLVLCRPGYDTSQHPQNDHIEYVNNKDSNVIQTSVSSSEVRKRISENKRNIEGLVPSGVMAHIVRYNLYS